MRIDPDGGPEEKIRIEYYDVESSSIHHGRTEKSNIEFSYCMGDR